MSVICLGELLVDMIGNEVGSLSEVKTFSKYPGGAAGNVAAGISKLGMPAAFIGRVSSDPFGDFLVGTLENLGVNCEGLIRDPDRKTTIAFVSLDKERKPNYLFYRENSANTFLSPDDLKEGLFRQAEALYFSSISLASSPIREANYEAVRLAHKHNCPVAFDPNVRLNVWPSRQKAVQEIHKMIGQADILKLNNDEFLLLFGEETMEQRCQEIFHNNRRLKLIAVTLGSEGCFLMTADGTSLFIDPIRSSVVDTTGAGDSFMSAVIVFWIKHNGVSDKESLMQLGIYANSAAYLTSQQPGVISALPYDQDIKTFIHEAYRDETNI